MSDQLILVRESPVARAARCQAVIQRVIFTKSLTEKPLEGELEPIEGKLSRVHRWKWEERPTGVLRRENVLRTVNSSEFNDWFLKVEPKQ